MKRSALLRFLRRQGCHLKREGASHSLWTNPLNGLVEAVHDTLKYPICWLARSAEALACRRLVADKAVQHHQPFVFRQSAKPQRLREDAPDPGPGRPGEGAAARQRRPVGSTDQAPQGLAPGWREPTAPRDVACSRPRRPDARPQRAPRSPRTAGHRTKSSYAIHSHTKKESGSD